MILPEDLAEVGVGTWVTELDTIVKVGMVVVELGMGVVELGMGIVELGMGAIWSEACLTTTVVFVSASVDISCIHSIGVSSKLGRNIVISFKKKNQLTLKISFIFLKKYT